MVIGICKLTGDEGPLVKAHILPEALTWYEEGNKPFAQSGVGHPPIRRWTSWYDPTIVTRKGEDILARYDNWAIGALRQHRLVWTGWGAAQTLVSPDFEAIPGTHHGYRYIAGLDTAMLRLFCLSLLWRAAASQMVEFAAIRLPRHDFKLLGAMLIRSDPRPLHRYPVTLIQHSTRGDSHNLTPIARKFPRDPSDLSKGEDKMFRFYLDGLAIRFYRKSMPRHVARLGDLIVGTCETLIVPTVTFEGSWQRSNMDLIAHHAEEQWPDRMGRIFRRDRD